MAVTDISKIYRGPGTGPGAPVSPVRKHVEKVYKPPTGKKGKPYRKPVSKDKEPEVIEVKEKPKVVDISKIYRGPGTGPGAPVSPIVTHVERISAQTTAEKLTQAQQAAFISRLQTPVPTVKTEAERTLQRVTEPVVEEYEAEIRTKPTKHIITTIIPLEEHVPTPYQPGTLPEEVEYGKRPKFDQPQVHEIIKEKILGAEAIWSRIGDPLGLRHRQLPFTVPFFGTPEEQAEMAEKQIGMAPGAATEAIMAYVGGYVLGGVTKVGVLGAREITRRGAAVVAPKVPEAFKIRKAVLGAERVIEPGVGVVFGAAVAKDLAETPKEELPEKIMELAVGFAGAEKGYRAPEKFIDIFRTRGRIELPVKEIIEPQILTGAEPFPYVKPKETVPELITRFKEPEFKLPGEEPGITRVWHAAPGKKPVDFQIELTKLRPGDLPGLYVAPSVSPHFLRTGMIRPKEMPKPSYLERFFSQQESLTPTIIRAEVPGVKRIPAHERLSLEASRRAVLKMEKAEAIITRDVELAQFRTGKVEAEAVIPPGSQLKRVGEKYYVQIGDRRVPIDSYVAEAMIKAPTLKEITVIKKGPKIRKEPDPYYRLPKDTRKKPYYRVDSEYPSEYIAPVPSERITPRPREEVPAIPSERIVPIPSEYIAPTPSEYIAPRPSEEITLIPSEYIAPRPSEEITPYTPVFVPPPPIPKLKPRYEKPKKPIGRVRKETPGYAWQLANPIASLEQLLGVQKTTKRKAPRKKSTKRKSRSKRK